MRTAFGASAFMDAWLVAFKIPNFLRRLFAEGSFSQSFVPVISEYKHKRPHDEVRELVDDVAGTFGVVLFVVTLIGVIAAPLIILAFAPGWHAQPDKFDLAVSMLHWTFPYLFFISLSALFSGVLNSYNRFALPAYTQVIMNVVMVITALWIAPHTANPGVTLAMGVFVSGLLQVGFQVPAVMRLGLFRRPRWRPAAEGVRRIGKLMLPGIFGSSMAQVSLLLDTQIAIVPDHGQRVVAVLRRPAHGVSAGRVQHRAGHRDPARPVASPRVANRWSTSPRTLDWALRLVIVLVSPAAVAMLVFAGPLTATTLRLRRVRRARRADGELRADGLFLGPARLQPGEGAGAGLLRAAGHEDSGARRPHRARLQHGAERRRGVAGASASAFPYPHILLATSTCISAAVNTDVAVARPGRAPASTRRGRAGAR